MSIPIDLTFRDIDIDHLEHFEKTPSFYGCTYQKKSLTLLKTALTCEQ